mmetsp:Transcript_8972/g.8328  ORF Transcript_8972/g.8328 Transcript_8972/m.8328 type:complete len:101 (+) Transcript_8972:1300-1602(+)
MEQKVCGYKKRIERLIKNIADYEKCETIRQAQAKRIDELKYKVKMLEQKEKWQWKSLVKKPIESDRKMQQKSMTSYNKSLKNVLCDEGEDLQNKMKDISN